MGVRVDTAVPRPAGMPVCCTAEEIKCEGGREISWSTSDGQLIAHTGTVRLDPLQDRTRLQAGLSYDPVAGALLLRADPKRKLHSDLLRLKSLVATGTVPHRR